MILSNNNSSNPNKYNLTILNTNNSNIQKKLITFMKISFIYVVPYDPLIIFVGYSETY